MTCFLCNRLGDAPEFRRYGPCPLVIVLSHWPHVAEQVAQQVAQLVASMKGLGHKLPNLLLNLCPSPFTLATCAATSCVLQRPRLYLDVTKGFHYVVESHGYSLPIRKWNF